MLANILSWKFSGDVGWLLHLKCNKLAEYRMAFQALPQYFTLSFRRETSNT